MIGSLVDVGWLIPQYIQNFAQSKAESWALVTISFA
jgi:hypothetical protein